MTLTYLFEVDGKRNQLYLVCLRCLHFLLKPLCHLVLLGLDYSFEHFETSKQMPPY